MDKIEFRMHLAAGKAYGQEATCGPSNKPKVRYNTQDGAQRAAARMSEQYGKDMEAYPCYWCDRWHIGRTMTAKERKQFANAPAA